MNVTRLTQGFFSTMAIQVAPTQVLIADDHKLVRNELRTLLEAEPDLTVVAEAADGKQAVAFALALQPDVVVADLSMPGADGIQVARELAFSLPATRVLVLSVNEEASLMREALAAGAAGYLTKRMALTHLASAVRAVARQETFLDPYFAQYIEAPFQREPAAFDATIDALTDEELRVLNMVARGYYLRQIADALKLDPETAARLRGRVSEKLGLRSRVDLVHYAQDHGLLRD